MAKAGFGGPKDRSAMEAPKCPDCGSKLERHQRIKIRINGVTYGENGMFWVCTNVDKPDKKVEHYVPKCGFEARA